jgi:uncharacterized protein (DUF2236 family)
VTADAAAAGLPEVGAADLEASLARLRAEVRDPRSGLFGPDSALWSVNRESIVFLGAGRAALLQLAHPHVAHAIDEHSRTRDDPFGRFQRTFARVFDMVYGDLEEAVRAARAVHALHARVRGPLPAGGPAAGYRANDPEALLWVHATLWDTSLQVVEAVRGPLPPAKKQRYYAETLRFARLFGIPDALVPQDLPAFQSYVADMLSGSTLAVTPVAREMARFLLRPLLPGFGLLMQRYGLVTAHLLPERLARDFGLERGGARGRARFEATLAFLRRVLPHLPRRLRLLPAYVAAERRLAGRTDRDRVGEVLSRLLVGAR